MRRMPKTHVLLIDDHAMFRTGLTVLLETLPGKLEVSTACSVADALHEEIEVPDVVLLDIFLQGLNGLDGIALLKRKWPHAPVIMLSSDTAPNTTQAALQRGAAAFISKEKTADHVADVIMQVLAQNSNEAPEPTPGTEPARHLTPRQSEVLDLLCQGLPNKAIGRKLGLSENTVRWHVQAVLAFLDVSNRSEAAFAARQRGLIG